MAQVRHPVADPSRAKSFEGERTHHSSFLAAIHLHDIVAYCAKHCKGKTRLKEEGRPLSYIKKADAKNYRATAKDLRGVLLEQPPAKKEPKG